MIPKDKATVGIITALPKEYAAVQRILENVEKISFPGQGAGRRYLIGEVCTSNEEKHTVVLCLASMGNNIAAIRASLLLNHFPQLESIIMVGIAGGIPNPEKPDDHVRLGDIVISNEKGVIQYDFDKETITENIDRHPPRPPSASLLEGVKLLEVDELMGEKPWLDFIDQALIPEGEQRPSIETDILASSTNPEQIVEHPQDPKRKNNEPRVFIAPIASANKLLKNPIKRDQLRDKFGAKAVEMEGSGIADATWSHEVGYLVVRGICDYCDSKKGDNWQAYAAAVAAAYTRALLESIPASNPSFLQGNLPLQSGTGNMAQPTYKNMSLSGEQRQQLQDALIDAFPKKSSLEQMLSFQLNKSLDVVAPVEGNLRDIVFELIKKAEAENWVGDLVGAARQENPGNQRLRTSAESLKVLFESMSTPKFSEAVTKPLVRDSFQLPRKLSIQELKRLCDLFLQCQSMQNPQSRKDIILNLRKEISSNTTIEGNANQVVLSVIKTSRRYSGGLAELLDSVEFYENDSVEMQNLRRIATQMLPEEFKE